MQAPLPPPQQPPMDPEQKEAFFRQMREGISKMKAEFAAKGHQGEAEVADFINKQRAMEEARGAAADRVTPQLLEFAFNRKNMTEAEIGEAVRRINNIPVNASIPGEWSEPTYELLTEPVELL